MNLAFADVYVLAAFACLVVARTKVLAYTDMSPIREEIPFFALAEVVVIGIANAVWLEQPFWRGVFVPIALTTLVVVLVLEALVGRRMHLPGFSDCEDFFATQSTHRSVGRGTRYRDGATVMYAILRDVLYWCLLVLLAASCFAGVVLRPDALFAAFTAEGRADGLLAANSYLFVGSLAGLLAGGVTGLVWRSRRGW